MTRNKNLVAITCIMIIAVTAAWIFGISPFQNQNFPSLGVSQGGTGLTTLTTNAIYKGAGASAITPSSITDTGTLVTVTGAPTLTFTNTTTGANCINFGTNVRATPVCLDNATAEFLINQNPVALAGAAGSGGYYFRLTGAAARSNEPWGWVASSTTATGTLDTTVSRDGAGVVDVGTAQGNTTGKLQASAFISKGTKFTTNGGCGESSGTIVGGGTAGAITTAGSVSCTTIVTMGDSATAPNGWACNAVDLTTAIDALNPHQSATTTTTATFVTGAIVANDVIQVSCNGY